MVEIDPILGKKKWNPYIDSLSNKTREKITTKYVNLLIHTLKTQKKSKLNGTETAHKTFYRTSRCVWLHVYQQLKSRNEINNFEMLAKRQWSIDMFFYFIGFRFCAIPFWRTFIGWVVTMWPFADQTATNITSKLIFGNEVFHRVN